MHEGFLMAIICLIKMRAFKLYSYMGEYSFIPGTDPGVYGMAIYPQWALQLDKFPDSISGGQIYIISLEACPRPPSKSMLCMLSMLCILCKLAQ